MNPTSSDKFSSSGSYSSGDKSQSKQPSAEEQELLAQRESDIVFRLRLLVIIILLLTSAAVSTVVFFITDIAQDDEFENTYRGNAEKIVNSFKEIPQKRIGAMASMKIALIAHGVDHTRKWPFVTLSSYQERASNVRALSGALFLAEHPIVNDDQRLEWEDYVVNSDDSSWMAEAHSYQHDIGRIHPMTGKYYHEGKEDYMKIEETRNLIYYLNEKDEIIMDPGPGPYLPVWLTAPFFPQHVVNQNILKNPLYRDEAIMCMETQAVVIGNYHTAPPGNYTSQHSYTSFYSNLLTAQEDEVPTEYRGEPFSSIFLPIFSSFEDDRSVVGILLAIVSWGRYFEDLLPPGSKGIVVVLENKCQEPYTFLIEGGNVEFLGQGDLHDSHFDKLELTASFGHVERISDGTRIGLGINSDYCTMDIRVYPTQELYDEYNTNMPQVITSSVAIVFFFTAMMFLVYDRLVERRQKIVLTRALQSSAIVSSLFPKAVRDQLMGQGFQNNTNQNKNSVESHMKGSGQESREKAIANLYPHCTVLFADIAGFTAWSSTREPAQVFVLLQTIYQAFDDIAKRRNVFKVETIGDCYVAVTGLPDPQPNHAIIMGRFAAEALAKMNTITKEMEVTLGPDTGDLTMRFGLNSGPVTAGVLRGDRARFQLFGDTVNTAARMESYGVKNRIHISESTAAILIAAGKDHWVTPRKDEVHAKGKGVMKTYFLNTNAKRAASANGSSNAASSDDDAKSEQQYEVSKKESISKRERLVDWICELLQDKIRAVLVARTSPLTKEALARQAPLYHRSTETTRPIDEVVEAIRLPKLHDAKTSKDNSEKGLLDLDPAAKLQLRAYVSTLASTYHANPFHNFEHACHVTMSVNKLLSRVITPDLNTEDGEDEETKLHSYTYGINSDPITLLAITFSAIIHDADHRGCSNVRLATEEKEMAAHYKNKSLAEQNSLDLSWNLLMAEQFNALRNCMFESEVELHRFRQVVVNTVLATDIFDKELIDLRKQRWEKAFSNEGECVEDINDLRATIVIEHIIQASDIAHTMQHWHVYRTWNEKLFKEMYLAYKNGRMGADPSTFWHKGEVGFFDNYVIPLAKKLKDCQVFGVSSDEYLSYALKNRAEWNARGEEILASMLADLELENASAK